MSDYIEGYPWATREAVEAGFAAADIPSDETCTYDWPPGILQKYGCYFVKDNKDGTVTVERLHPHD